MPGWCKGKRGPRTDNRLFLDALPWMTRAGGRWCDRPERFGQVGTVKRRYYDWMTRGVLAEILAVLAKEPDLDACDNAMGKGVFSTLERELLARRRFRSQAEARMAVFSDVEGFYTPRRRHSATARPSSPSSRPGQNRPPRPGSARPSEPSTRTGQSQSAQTGADQIALAQSMAG